MNATTNIIGSVAALKIAKSSENTDNNSKDESKDINELNTSSTTNNTKQPTLVMTPKTTNWYTIAILLVVGTLGLLFVILYSIFVKDD